MALRVAGLPDQRLAPKCAVPGSSPLGDPRGGSVEGARNVDSGVGAVAVEEPM
jgi:hypothetical protein